MKIHKLKCLVQTENIDVIAVTETFKDTANIDFISEYSIDGFKFFNNIASIEAEVVLHFT